jgi:Flp pilus assembly pilin Flp
MDLIIKFACDEDGAPSLEYAIVLSLIGVFLITGIGAVGNSLFALFTAMTARLGGG